MGLFSRKKQFGPQNISVLFNDDNEGYTHLIVNGIVYGKAKAGGYMLINEDLPGSLKSEAMVAFTAIMMGKKDKEEIANLIAEFRNYSE